MEKLVFTRIYDGGYECGSTESFYTFEYSSKQECEDYILNQVLNWELKAKEYNNNIESIRKKLEQDTYELRKCINKLHSNIRHLNHNRQDTTKLLEKLKKRQDEINDIYKLYRKEESEYVCPVLNIVLGNHQIDDVGNDWRLETLEEWFKDHLL